MKKKLSVKMLKILETTPNRLVIKSERRNFDALIIVLFIYVAIYFLLISTLKKWTIFGLNQKAVESIYQSVASPGLYDFSSIALIICGCFLFAMTIADFHLPARTIIFDCNSHLLTIKYTYLFWHYKKDYFLNEIESIQWFPETIYAGSSGILSVQVLKLIRRKPNGKTHLIRLYKTVHPELQEISTVVDVIHRFLLGLRQSNKK
ncbi:MAG: hypothetical protein V7K69_27235 [Nostoc sp.]